MRDPRRLAGGGLRHGGDQGIAHAVTPGFQFTELRSRQEGPVLPLHRVAGSQVPARRDQALPCDLSSFGDFGGAVLICRHNSALDCSPWLPCLPSPAAARTCRTNLSSYRCVRASSFPTIVPPVTR